MTAPGAGREAHGDLSWSAMGQAAERPRGIQDKTRPPVAERCSNVYILLFCSHLQVLCVQSGQVPEPGNLNGYIIFLINYRNGK